MTAQAMLAKNTEDARKNDHSEFDLNGKLLQINEKAILHCIFSHIGPTQVTSSVLAFEPSWIVEK